MNQVDLSANGESLLVQEITALSVRGRSLFWNASVTAIEQLLLMGERSKKCKQARHYRVDNAVPLGTSSLGLDGPRSISSCQFSELSRTIGRSVRFNPVVVVNHVYYE